MNNAGKAEIADPDMLSGLSSSKTSRTHNTDPVPSRAVVPFRLDFLLNTMCSTTKTSCQEDSKFRVLSKMNHLRTRHGGKTSNVDVAGN
jgi:hypothetical protein